MIIANEKVNLKVTLFRGDNPQKHSEIENIGIQAERRWSESGLSETDWFQLIKQSIHTLPFTAKEQIKKHVLKPEGWRSPFVSFTPNKNVARCYALGRYKRKEGLLITAIITITEKYYLPFENFGELLIPLDKPAILLDNVRRCWIHLPNVPFSMAGSIEAGMTKFYKNINRDDEFLLLGDLRPNEFRIKMIRLET